MKSCVRSLLIFSIAYILAYSAFTYTQIILLAFLV